MPEWMMYLIPPGKMARDNSRYHYQQMERSRLPKDLYEGSLQTEQFPKQV